MTAPGLLSAATKNSDPNRGSCVGVGNLMEQRRHLRCALKAHLGLQKRQRSMGKVGVLFSVSRHAAGSDSTMTGESVKR